MLVVYNGHFSAVQIPAAGNVVAERGVPVEVPDKVGKSLVRQATFTESKPEPKPKAAPVADDKEGK